jgi:hypothetical protein
VAAVRGVTSGTFDSFVAELEKTEYEDPGLAELKEKLLEGKERVLEAVRFVKSRSTAYLDLSGRRLVDAAIAVICGHLLIGQGVNSERKRRVARRFIETRMPLLRMNCEQVLAGDMTPLEEYELLAGPVPASD